MRRSRYASTEEVIAVLQGARPYGGVHDTHQRDESSYTIGLLNSVREAIRIGRETGLTTNIGHIKALGVDVSGDADSVLALMRAARATGHLVVADQYPWTASGTSLVASLVPRWAESGGRDSLKLRISDSTARTRMLAEMRENLRRRVQHPAADRRQRRGPALRGQDPPEASGRGEGHRRRRNRPRTDWDGGRHERRSVQHDRAGHRDLHEGSLRDDQLRRFGWSSTRPCRSI